MIETTIIHEADFPYIVQGLEEFTHEDHGRTYESSRWVILAYARDEQFARILLMQHERKNAYRKLRIVKKES